MAPSYVGCGHHAESRVQYQSSQAISQARLCAQQRRRQRSSAFQSLHATSAAQKSFRLQLCSPHENSGACSSLPGLHRVTALAQQHGDMPSNAATLDIHSPPARRGSLVAHAGGGSLMEVFQAIQVMP